MQNPGRFKAVLDEVMGRIESDTASRCLSPEVEDARSTLDHWRSGNRVVRQPVIRSQQIDRRITRAIASRDRWAVALVEDHVEAGKEVDVESLVGVLRRRASLEATADAPQIESATQQDPSLTL